jgi:hypothetical protein
VREWEVGDVRGIQRLFQPLVNVLQNFLQFLETLVLEIAKYRLQLVSATKIMTKH